MVVEVVGNCPRCGAPVYGPRQVNDSQFYGGAGGYTPSADVLCRRMCDCLSRLNGREDEERRRAEVLNVAGGLAPSRPPA